MLALVAGLGAIFAGIIAIEPVRTFFDLEVLSGGQWFLALAVRRARPRPRRRGLAAALHPAARAARGRRARARRRPRADAHAPHRRVRRGRDAGAGGEPGARARRLQRGAHHRRPDREDAQNVNVHRRTKIVDHDRAGDAHRRGHGRADRGRRRRLPVQLLPRHPRRPLRERRDGARGGGADRQGGRDPRRPARAEAPHRRRRRRDRRPAARAARSCSRPRTIVGSDETLSVSYDGLPEAVTKDGLVYLADGRIRLRVLEAGDDEVRCSVEVGGRVSSHQGLNLPGRRGRAAGRRARGPRLGRLRDRARHRPARGLVRAPRRGPGAGRAPGAHRRLGHPGDREDREAAGGRARRGDRQGGEGRGSWSPAATSGSSSRSSRCPGSSATCWRSPAATRSRRSPPPRCSPRWSPRRARPGPRSPTSPTRSSRAPTR